jgi:acyl carrier protein
MAEKAARSEPTITQDLSRSAPTARTSASEKKPMDLRNCLREGLFTGLLSLPRENWPDDDTNLFGLGLDSLRVMRLLVFVEQDLGVVLPDEAITPETIGSVRALLRPIEAHQRR